MEEMKEDWKGVGKKGGEGKKGSVMDLGDGFLRRTFGAEGIECPICADMTELWAKGYVTNCLKVSL